MFLLPNNSQLDRELILVMTIWLGRWGVRKVFTRITNIEKPYLLYFQSILNKILWYKDIFSWDFYEIFLCATICREHSVRVFRWGSTPSTGKFYEGYVRISISKDNFTFQIYCITLLAHLLSCGTCCSPVLLASQAESHSMSGTNINAVHAISIWQTFCGVSQFTFKRNTMVHSVLVNMN